MRGTSGSQRRAEGVYDRLVSRATLANTGAGASGGVNVGVAAGGTAQVAGDGFTINGAPSASNIAMAKNQALLIRRYCLSFADATNTGKLQVQAAAIVLSVPIVAPLGLPLSNLGYILASYSDNEQQANLVLTS